MRVFWAFSRRISLEIYVPAGEQDCPARLRQNGEKKLQKAISHP